MWVCITVIMAAQFSASAYVGIYHILREASVFARSTEMGNTRASDSGTGERYRPHVFL